MNIIQMKTWIASFKFLSLIPKWNKGFTSILILGLCLGTQTCFAQNIPAIGSKRDTSSASAHIRPTHRDTVPSPKSVLLKSAIIPGWGQAVNKQYWKIPIIYGALAGLAYFSSYMTQRYHDYRAAYYNSVSTHTDQRFGKTPAYLIGQSPKALQYYRNYYRNHRDMVYLGIGLAYGLNILDAYIYAQMRDFNVSNDLSVRTTVGPQQVGPYQALSLKLTFHFARP